jgi:uncharacterized protein with FMN-binding domain
MNKAIVGLVVVTLLVVAATATVLLTSTQKQEPTATTTGTSVSSGTPASTNENYKDGQYTANGSYLTPGGNESIDVTLTIEDRKVTQATIAQNAISNEAKQFQSQFNSGYQNEVVGKDIDSIRLSRVAGSSLTPGGFNNALEDIKNQAKA